MDLDPDARLQPEKNIGEGGLQYQIPDARLLLEKSTAEEGLQHQSLDANFRSIAEVGWRYQMHPIRVQYCLEEG